MAIYISKKAVELNPFNERVINTEDQKPGPLRSNFLKELQYLQNLASNDINFDAITISNHSYRSKEIIRIKIALNIIDDYVDTSGPNNTIYDIAGGPFVTNAVNSGVFDTRFFDAIKAFQVFADIPVTGRIDGVTIIKIDTYLDDEIVIDTIQNKVIGEKSNKMISVSSDTNTYQIVINDKTYVYTSLDLPDNYLKVRPIIGSVADSSDDFIFVGAKELGDLKEEIIIQNSINDDIEKQKILDVAHFSIKSDNLKRASQPNIPINNNTLQDEINLAPPMILPDSHARLHLVSGNDDLLDLITAEYYNGQELELVDPFSETNDVFHTIPSRVLNSDIGSRAHDARLQFYLNLIYYYNTPETGLNGDYTEFGIIKANGYQRYNDDYLNAYNLYDNEFDSSNPDSVLPNYYRFLKAQEQNGSTVEFDPTTGKPTSFTLNPGKYIWIPSRQFIETQYYHMNFRHNSMLKDDVTNYVSDLVAQQVIDAMQQPSIWDIIEQVVGDFTDFLKEETLELFEETLAFFKDAYEFAINTVAANLWRGIGGLGSGGIGVTWGYPIATDIYMSRAIWRKMTKLDELTFVLREDFDAFIGLDIGIGGSIGFKTGNGKKKKSANMALGVGAAAGLKAGLRPNGFFQYEFPIRPEETAIIVMVLTAFTSSDKTQIVSSLLGTLNIVNLDPRQYLAWSRMGLAVEANAWGVAQLGFDASGNPKEDKNVKKPIDNNQYGSEVNEKSGLTIENIWNKLPGIGINADGRIALGGEIEYKADYKDNPKIPEIDARVPSKVEIENFYYISGTLVVAGIGGLMQRLLFWATSINPFLSLFTNIDTGLGFGFAHTYTRTTSAKETQQSDIDASGAFGSNIPLVSNPNNGGLQIGNANGNWQSHLVLAQFSGDVDGMYITGSAETKLKFDLYKIREAIDAQNDFFSFNSIDNILQLFYSIELQYLPSLSGNSKRRKLANSFFSEIGTLKTGTQKELLQTAKLIKGFNFNFYTGANVKVEFKLQNFYIAFKYFIKRWYLMLQKYTVGTDEGIEEWKEIKAEIENKTTEFKEEFYIEEEKVVNSTCYGDLYFVLDNFLKDEYGATDTVNYKNVAIECLLLAPRLLKVLTVDLALEPLVTVQGAYAKVTEDLKLNEFVEALTTLSEIIDISASLEVKAGAEYTLGGKISALAKIRASLTAGGAVIYRNLFLENSVPVVLQNTDDLAPFIDALNRLADPSLDNQNPDGIRQTFNILPK